VLDDLRVLVSGLYFDTLGADVVIAPDTPEPIAARGIWLEPSPEQWPDGPVQTRRPRTVLALREPLTRGTLVDAPGATGGDVLRWRLEREAETYPDHVRWVVSQVTDEE
jgi:hypothetical protein